MAVLSSAESLFFSINYYLVVRLREMAAAVREGHAYFYGHTAGKPFRQFSQFFPAPFEHEGAHYSCNEQWMMASKAKLMGDERTLASIMAAGSPSECKRLGRSVKPWDQEKWDAHKYDIVLEGTRLKMKHSEEARRVLLETGNKHLAEASPTDRIWGIGISVKDAEAGRSWRGENLLGKALMQVRDEILAEQKK